jgi:hypothetical protein
MTIRISGKDMELDGEISLGELLTSLKIQVEDYMAVAIIARSNREAALSLFEKLLLGSDYGIGGHTFALSNACAKSEIMSSASSMPNESLTSESLIPAFRLSSGSMK